MPSRRHGVDLVPEIAPRLGIDAGGGFIEQQELRLMQQAGGERQALLPAARQRARQLVAAVVQAEPLQRRLDPLVAAVEAEDPRGELQVFLDGQVLVEPELLRHIADVALDFVGLLDDVVAKAGAAAGIRLQQAAQHADAGGLAAAVGAEEAVDLPARHLQRQIMHDRLAVETLAQALDVDGERGAHDPAPGIGRTSTGSPGCQGWLRSSGLASTRNTSFSRRVWL